MWRNAQVPAALVTFTEEILNGKLFCFFLQWKIQCLMLNGLYPQSLLHSGLPSAISIRLSNFTWKNLWRMFASNKQSPQAIFWYKSNIEKQTENQINP